MESFEELGLVAQEASPTPLVPISRSTVTSDENMSQREEKDAGVAECEANGGCDERKSCTDPLVTVSWHQESALFSPGKSPARPQVWINYPLRFFPQQLRWVSVPDSVECLGIGCFALCKSLSRVTLVKPLC